MKLKDVSVGYNKPLVKIKDLELKKGQLYVLFGANGKGKSTLLKTLTGQVKPISGSVRIGDKSLENCSALERSTILTMVNSRFAGVPFMSGLEFLRLGRTPYTNALGRLSSADHELIQYWSKQQGVTHLLSNMTLAMSDGERQMLALTRALIQEVDYLFLDEPTAFLDYQNKKRVLTDLSNLAKETNKMILVTSHDIELCLAHAPHILALPKNDQHLIILPENASLDKVVATCFDAFD